MSEANKQLRQDLICEQMRETQEIRKRLAECIRTMRHFQRGKQTMIVRDIMTCLDTEIRTLRWVLGDSTE